MVQAVTDEPDLNALILEALRGGHGAASRLFEPAERYALHVVAARAPDLPEDLRDDVFQESMELLLRSKPGAYDPARSSPKWFFRQLLINAIRRVRVGFTLPGQVMRQRGKPGPAPVGGQEASEAASVPLSFDEIAGAIPDPGSLDPFAAIEARIDAARVLAAAPSITAEALRLIYLEEVPIENVAAVFLVSRFALRWQIRTFAAEWQSAA